MSDTWMILLKKRTTKKRTIIEDGLKHHETLSEHCSLCYKTNCDLIGLYGTWNEFGSFKGVCKECLNRLNELLNEDEK